MAKKKDAAASGGEAAENSVAKSILVSASREGFRRCGRAWSVEQTEVSVDEFDEEQLKQLLAEPMLTVVFKE